MKIPLRRSFLGVLLLLCAGINAGAGGTSSAQFMKIDTSVRSMGLGGAFTGVAGDVDSIVANPAGLASVTSIQQTFTHAAWLEGMHIEYGAIAARTGDSSAIGLAVQYLGADGIGRVNKFGDEVGTYGASSLLGTVSYARRFSGRFSAGTSIKLLQEKIDDESASAYAADIGVNYDLGKAGFGIAVKNIGTPVTFIREAFPLPTTIRVGASYTPVANLMLVSDIVLPSDSALAIHAGGEYWYRGMKNCAVAVRAGVNTAEMASFGLPAGAAFGMGMNWNDAWGIDYTFAPYGLLGQRHVIGVKIKLSASGAAEGKEERGGRTRFVPDIPPENIYEQAKRWYQQKARETGISRDEKRMILEKLDGKFGALGIDTSWVKERMRELQNEK